MSARKSRPVRVFRSGKRCFTNLAVMGWDRSDFDIGWMAGVFFTKKSSEGRDFPFEATVRTLHLRLLGPITGKGRLTWLLDLTVSPLIRDRKLLAELLWRPCGWTLAPRAAPRYPRSGVLWRFQMAWPRCLEAMQAMPGAHHQRVPDIKLSCPETRQEYSG